MVNWHLLPNEKRIHQASVSRKLFFSYYFVVALFFVAAVGINFIDYPIPKLYPPIALLVGGFIAYLAVERKRDMEIMLITDERVLILRRPEGVRGSMTMESIPFDKLSNVQVVQTRKQRIMGTGDVVFKLPGEEHTVTDIAQPYELERAIYRILDIERKKGVSKTAG